MPTSGICLDMFDDPELEVLTRVLEGREPPPLLKTAHPLYREDLEHLPDSEFALVFNSGGYTFRKFACVDAGHTALECIYFLENHDQLPEDLRKEAAENLSKACRSFGVPVPDELDALTAGGDPGIRTSMSAAPPAGRTLLEGRYPVDSVDQVKEAEAYYMEHGARMPPRDRREYCSELVKAAEAFGVTLDDNVQHYGAPGYGPEVDVYLSVRRGLLPQAAAEVLDKVASVMPVTAPEVFAETLAEFDSNTGLHHYYDEHVADPWWSTFGQPINKTAEYTWEEGAERVTGSDLQELAANGRALLSTQFSDELVSAFVENPVQQFEALPRPQKIIVARMAADSELPSGSGNLSS